MRPRFATNQKFKSSAAASATKSNESSTSYSSILRWVHESTSICGTSCSESFLSQSFTPSPASSSTSWRLHTAAENPSTGGRAFKTANNCSSRRVQSHARLNNDVMYLLRHQHKR